MGRVVFLGNIDTSCQMGVWWKWEKLPAGYGPKCGNSALRGQIPHGGSGNDTGKQGMIERYAKMSRHRYIERFMKDN
jgi:hypothetical protein